MRDSLSSSSWSARASWLACALCVVLGGCFETRVLPSEVPQVGDSTSALVGAEGVDLAIADLHVIVPAGAVAEGTTITVSVEDAPTAGPFDAYSPIIRFSPSDVALAAPVEIRLPFRGDPTLASAFVASGGGGAFAARPTTVMGDVATTSLSYLEDTFVGSACEGTSCLCEPASMLDLLVVIDDSSSMFEEQALLHEQLPGLFRALATGDLDGDGTQDVPAFASVRVGITSTDMGVGAAPSVPTCPSGLGDDGVLLADRGPTADASCTTPTYASPIASYGAADPSGLEAFVAQVSCTSSLGDMGCGFEQQLEAALVALSPNAPTSYTAPGWTVPLFADGRRGQGDEANAGFLRDGALLAVLVVSDEDDCSTMDSGIFDPTDARFSSVDMNLRCHAFPEVLFPIERFVDGIVGLRPHPEDVVVAAIVGAPTGVDTSDLDALLADPGMVETVDPAMPNRLLPACASANGMAFPARRIVGTLAAVEHFGGRAIVQSICDPSFDALTRDLATELAARAGGDC